ncbi:TRAP transporter small permease [Piscibacillus salipiscarius]|uniref:TRAP transporter small permease n=1 Tax=Piscibacillus salipiscarius TaxID=299480 RepID=A0ABW5QAC8_9BACI|nr:TRAP transporter small permease [Piscibacillus salipiscarius]
MEKIVRLVCKGLQYVAQFVLFIMALMVTLDVIGRKFFKAPITGTVDVVEVGLIVVIFASIAYTHLNEEHITVDFVVEKFPEKLQYVVEIIINVVIAILMILISWSMWNNAQRLLDSNTVTGDIELPMFIFAVFSVIGTVMFALVAVVLALRYRQKVIRK